MRPSLHLFSWLRFGSNHSVEITLLVEYTKEWVPHCKSIRNINLLNRMTESLLVSTFGQIQLLTKSTFRLTTDQFETLRIYSIIAVIAFRLIMMPNYLQSYLNLAYHKLEEMKLEAGKISNIDLQKTLSRIFYYLCVVSPMLNISRIFLFLKTYKP